MRLKTAVVVSLVVVLAGCSGLSGESTPTPDMSEPEITVQSPTPEETQEPTDAPQPTVTDTPTKDGPTDTPTDATDSAPDWESNRIVDWPPFNVSAGGGGSYSTPNPPSASAGGSGNVSAK